MNTISSGLPGLLDATLILQSPKVTSYMGPDVNQVLPTDLNSDQLASSPYGIPHLKRWLGKAGIAVSGGDRYFLSVRGAPHLLSRLVDKKIVQVQRDVCKTPVDIDAAEIYQFLSRDGGLSSSAEIKAEPYNKWAAILALELPCYFASGIGMSLPPKFGRWHLQPPTDIQVALKTPACHRAGVTGRNVTIAMIDSGISRHRHFEEHKYDISRPKPEDGIDSKGHGTGEVSNIFSVAPDVKVISIYRDIAQSLAAFRRAMELKPDVINCSWAFELHKHVFDPHRSLDLLIRDAVASGITVVCAAGNGLHGFPAQHPDVISVGAAYLDANNKATLTQYSSSFISKVYPSRHVPDVVGLAGESLDSPYLHLPVPPGSEYDRQYSDFQKRDQNGIVLNDRIIEDGWAAFSGTSAAAPQVSGICALLLQANRNLKPHELKFALMSSARKVSMQNSSSRDPRAGSGLVDAEAALSKISVS